jgi:HSP20 family molecular chaperone IbpA
MYCQTTREKTNGTQEGEDFVFTPNVNLIESGEAVVAQLEVPGAGPEDIEITLEKRVLTVTAKVKKEQPEGFRPLHQEYETGNYERSFTLHEEIDGSGIGAEVRDGILTLTLPKCEEAQPRRIIPTAN